MAAAPNRRAQQSSPAATLDSYLAIGKDGTVEVFFGAIDGGQGLEISIAQMVAEELDAPFESIRMVMSDTARTINMGGASGALSVSRRGFTLRKAAAEARRILVGEAARKLGAEPGALTVSDGVISVAGDAAKRATFAELIGDQKFGAEVKWNGQWGNGHDIAADAPLKKPPNSS